MNTTILTQTLDCQHHSSPGQGTSGVDQDDTREVLQHGERNQEQEQNSDLGSEGRNQHQKQKQEIQENPRSMSDSEKIENLLPEKFDQKDAVPDVIVTNLEESEEQEGPEEDTRSVTASSVMEGPEEDTRSVTASSVMSLFQRMQMDPLEREWLRCAALGNAVGLRQLLLQDPSLTLKKDFVTGFTALHWAAKQGRIETVDMMARSGADVNQRAHGGYTALHLASLHGHGHIIQLLINNYNAKVNIRDYHGKMAAHYWNGSMDVFNMSGSHSGGKWSRGRHGQRYGQFSSLLFRSRSQGNLNVELIPGSLELTPRLLPRSETNCQPFMDTF